MSGYNDFMVNPWTQMGLGILAANRPGASAGQAIGQGLLGGMSNMQKLEDWQQRQQEREKTRKFLDQKFGQDIPTPFALEMFKSSLEQPKSTDDIREYQMAVAQGFQGTFMDYMNRVKPLSAPKITNQMPGLEKGPKSDLQGKSISAKMFIPQIDQLMSDIRTLPEGVGGIASFRQDVSGVAGQLADIGVPGAASVSEWANPQTWVYDPTVPGGKRNISAQTINTRTESLTIGLKPIMADSGPLSENDRIRLNTAVGNTATADSKRRLDAWNTVREVLTDNAEIIDDFLRKGGAVVPGEAIPRANTKAERDALPSGAQYVAPDGSVRTKK